MHELLQSAREAARQGDKSKALELIKQVINSNPNDIDALLTLATIVDESMRKRQILNRVLSLDATNKAAREMILEMDRAEINAYHQHSPGISIPESQPVSETRHASQDSISNQTSTTFFDKPRIFRYPAGCMAILYVFTFISCCGTLWFAAIRWSYSFPFLVLFLVMTLALGYFLVTTSSKAETDDKGIRVASWFRTIEMKWDEIIDFKIDSLRGNLILRSSIGESAKISTNIQGYRTIMEILQEKLPNLYAEAISSQKQRAVSSAGLASSYSSTYGEKISAAGPKGQPEPASPISTFPSNMQTSTPVPISRVETASVAQTHGMTDDKAGKTTVFRYPARGRIGYFVVAAIMGLTGFMIAAQGSATCIPLLGMALLFGLAALSNQSSVTVSESDIRLSNLLSKSEIKWNEIASLKSNGMGKKLELTSNNGNLLKISTQIEGYPVIVETLRQRRPDLFNVQATSTAQKNAPAMEHSLSFLQNQGTSTFGEARSFRKNFFKQYGMSLLGVSFGSLFIWLAAISSEERVAFIAVAGFCALIMIIPFFQVSTVKVEPNKLTIETFFEQKEFTAHQIREIKMNSIQGRYGRVINVINVTPVEGKNYPLGGFSDGDEIIYGILMSWWNTYRIGSQNQN